MLLCGGRIEHGIEGKLLAMAVDVSAGRAHEAQAQAMGELGGRNLLLMTTVFREGKLQKGHATAVPV